MELALSLGDAPKPFQFLNKTQKMDNNDIGLFCMSLGNEFGSKPNPEEKSVGVHENGDEDEREVLTCSDPPVQLELLPLHPVLPRTQSSSPQLRFPWLTDNLIVETGSNQGQRRAAATEEEAEDKDAALSSPNSAMSSFQMDYGVGNGGRSSNNKRDLEVENENERPSSRASDDEENGSTRKKLRLSKEQSAFLEESFKEHSTLNPKQKLALAKQLNLRTRQVEVWFQNRRARTKLKQTEVDCEYLKRCCETLTEENRRLQKEVQELRALKTSQHFNMQLPATTLTMCPSCERVSPTATTNASMAAAFSSASKPAVVNASRSTNNTTSLSLGRASRLYPFSHSQTPKLHQTSQPHQAAS